MHMCYTACHIALSSARSVIDDVVRRHLEATNLQVQLKMLHDLTGGVIIQLLYQWLFQWLLISRMPLRQYHYRL
jgi:hypothetical protein